MERLGVYAVAFVVFAFITGIMADRKNRNAVAWGLFGGLSPVLALLVLMFMPFLCPKCKGALTNSEHKNGDCPHCELTSRREASAGIEALVGAIDGARRPCPKCGARVIPMKDGTCPACRVRSFASGSEAAVPSAKQAE